MINEIVMADGFLDLITVKSEEVKSAIESVTFVVVILMVVITAVKTKMSIAAILMSAIELLWLWHLPCAKRAGER